MKYSVIYVNGYRSPIFWFSSRQFLRLLIMSDKDSNWMQTDRWCYLHTLSTIFSSKTLLHPSLLPITSLIQQLTWLTTLGLASTEQLCQTPLVSQLSGNPKRTGKLQWPGSGRGCGSCWGRCHSLLGSDSWIPILDNNKHITQKFPKFVSFS